MEYLYQVVIL